MKSFFKKEREEIGKVFQIVPRKALLGDANSDIDLFLIEHGKFSAMFDGKMYVCILIHRDAKGRPVIRAEKMNRREFNKYFEIPVEVTSKCVGELQ